MVIDRRVNTIETAQCRQDLTAKISQAGHFTEEKAALGLLIDSQLKVSHSRWWHLLLR